MGLPPKALHKDPQEKHPFPLPLTCPYSPCSQLSAGNQPRDVSLWSGLRGHRPCGKPGSARVQLIPDFKHVSQGFPHQHKFSLASLLEDHNTLGPSEKTIKPGPKSHLL